MKSIIKYISLTLITMLLLVSLSACGKKNEDILFTRYVSFGTGSKTMVVVPGLSIGYVTDSEDALKDAFKDFTDDYTVYVFDVRDNVPENYTIEQMGDDLVKAIKDVGLNDIYMYGCSMGGMESIYIAGKYPDLVSKVAVAASMVKANETSDKVVLNWISLAKEKKCHELTADMGEQIYSQAVYESLKSVFSQMADGLDDALLTRFINTASVIPGLDITEEAKSVKCPVLILGAKGDRVLTSDASEEIAELTHGEIFIYSEDFPHAVYDEAPDLRGKVKEFFDR